MTYNSLSTLVADEMVTVDHMTLIDTNLDHLHQRKGVLSIPPVIQAASAATLGDFFTGGFDNTAAASTKFTNLFFVVPDDAASIDSIEVLIVSSASTTIEYNITADYGNPDNNEAYNNHSGSSVDQTLAVTANRLTLISLAGILLSLAAGDFAGVLITTSSGANAATWHVLGARMIYTRT
jgi:hypothetical protein